MNSCSASLLLDHHTAPIIGKRKSKCMRTSLEDVTLMFSDGLTMGEVINTTGKVLVGRVRDRAYFAK